MKHKKILPAHHTGKLRHHRHTSYGVLALALLLTCTLLAAASRSVALASADPVTAENSVYAVVPGPAPTVAPVITNIPQGAVYTTADPLTVSGTCQSGTLIKIFKNEVLAGAVLCQNGHFSIQIDLFFGTNTLIARSYNTLNESGPQSAPVVVTKSLPGVSFTDYGKQFFVTSDIYFKGVNVGETLSWPLTIGGGQAPYAISVAWGDGTTDLVSRGVAGSFTIQHTYNKAGTGDKGSYDVTILASDATGSKSFIHLVSIVNGQPSVVASIKRGYDWSTAIRLAWQVAIIAILVIGSFWLGERREVRILRKQAKTV